MDAKGFAIRRLVLGAAVLLWAVAVGAGSAGLWRYSLEPGDAASPPTSWPAGSRIPAPAGRASLVVLAHPHCPCTRATVGELSRLMASVDGRVDVHVLLLQPAGMSDEWVDTDLWTSAAAIPGVTVWADAGGTEARRFGAHTSGETILYDGGGRLRFDGGITAARGHAGDNLGRSALVRLLIDDGTGGDGTAGVDDAPVFGCPLFDPKASCTQGGDTCSRDI